MIYLDHFKNINDTYGHATGDHVLHELAERCKHCIRYMDYVGHYGDEEFVVILPETNADIALIMAERLRTVIAAKPMKPEESLGINVTVRLGVAQRDENTKTLNLLIARANQAMYVAKQNGRNRVVANA